MWNKLQRFYIAIEHFFLFKMTSLADILKSHTKGIAFRRKCKVPINAKKIKNKMSDRNYS